MNYHTLVVIDHYLPGRKFGGPVTTVSNMLICLNECNEYLVLTRDHDLDNLLYLSVEANKIRRMGGSDVLYLESSRLSLRDLKQYADLLGIKIIYLNSFFSRLSLKFLILRRLGFLSQHFILAPRGEFSPGAYALKKRKKQIYTWLLTKFGLLQNLRWQVSSELEQQELQNMVHVAVDIHIAPDIFLADEFPNVGQRKVDHFIFLSRISRKKNLKYAIDLLSQLKEPAILDIYGSLEDQEYWRECQTHIKRLPAHVQANYCGELPYSEVRPTMARYGALLFPTLGENYGHVIPEALASGTPIITSDQTPWSDLEAQGVGWSIPLSRPEGYLRAMEVILSQPADQALARAQACMLYAKRLSRNEEVIRQNQNLFDFKDQE